MLINNIKPLLLSLIMVHLTACSVMNTKPLESFGTAELTPNTNMTRELNNLPLPRGKIVTAVYGFKDQSGQYKANPDSNFSTAVTQGGTSILVKALRDSKWFMPVERENLQNVLTERKIIRAIEQPNDSETKNPIKLPTLMGAKLLIEGAVVGYDSNIKTGGLGVKYLGVGSAGQYRADQVTVNLRAVDANTGQILHTVSTTKTVYSTQLTSGVYKFISYKSLLEAEVGTTLNEPVQIAVQEAIEAAVVNLIVEGIDNRSWLLANDSDKNAPIFQRYRQQRMDNLALNDTQDKAKKIKPTMLNEVDNAFDSTKIKEQNKLKTEQIKRVPISSEAKSQAFSFD